MALFNIRQCLHNHNNYNECLRLQLAITKQIIQMLYVVIVIVFGYFNMRSNEMKWNGMNLIENRHLDDLQSFT